MRNIEFTDYDRGVDTLLYFNSDYILKFIVSLSSPDKFGNRNFFAYEYEYESKYHDQTKSRSVNRSMRYFYSINNKKNFESSFILRSGDVLMLCDMIEKIFLPLYFSNKRIFSEIDGKLFITGEVNPVILYHENSFIKFEPCIYTYEDGAYKEGVRMTLNSEAEFVDMTIDKFMDFYSILKITDMYSAACNIINYIKLPPYDCNTWERGSGLGAPPRNNDDSWANNYEQKPVKPTNTFLKNLKKGE